MITLDQIVNSNLEMLKSQEAELLRSLSFVQKAKQLFEGRNGTGSPSPAGKRLGRKPSAAKKPTVASAKPAGSKSVSAKPAKKAAKSSAGTGKVTRLDKILAAMKQKNAPIASGELIQTLFKQQKEDKNFGHFRQLVYTTLTQAFKKGVLKRKGDKISLS